MTTKGEAGGREGCVEEDKECVEHAQALGGVHRDCQGLRKGNQETQGAVGDGRKLVLFSGSSGRRR